MSYLLTLSAYESYAENLSLRLEARTRRDAVKEATRFIRDLREDGYVRAGGSLARGEEVVLCDLIHGGGYVAALVREEG